VIKRDASIFFLDLTLIDVYISDMPRIARVVVEGLPYHITQRGNRRENVFFRNKDYQQYLRWLQEYSKEAGLEVYAYCLMSNHVHIVCVPREADSLVRAFKPLHMRYAQHINRRRGWKGHLWQERFYSSVLDESYLWTAVKYVERNPVRARIVRFAENYDWSSASAHCGRKEDSLLSPNLPLLREVADWSKWLREGEDAEAVNLLRRNTERGIPCGSEGFVNRLEKLLKRFLRFRPIGRPRIEERGK
jgi:putative transposase